MSHDGERPHLVPIRNPFWWFVLSLVLLTFCGGSTSDDRGAGGSAGTGGTAGTGANGGFSGHTSDCVGPGASCGGQCGPCPDSGSAGAVGGTVGNGGFSGHTSDCIGYGAGTECGGGCPPCPDSGSAGAVGGSVGNGGFSGHTGDCISGCGASCPYPCWDGGDDGAGGLSDAGDAALDGNGSMGTPSSSSFKATPPKASIACYSLAGYGTAPCLPADDTLLSWLRGAPKHCQARVVGGPFLTSEPKGRACCYDVTCGEP